MVKQSQSIASNQSYNDKDLPIITMGTVSITVIMLIAYCPRFSTIIFIDLLTVYSVCIFSLCIKGKECLAFVITVEGEGNFIIWIFVEIFLI